MCWKLGIEANKLAVGLPNHWKTEFPLCVQQFSCGFFFWVYTKENLHFLVGFQNTIRASLDPFILKELVSIILEFGIPQLSKV
jgi:hypothetical protein